MNTYDYEINHADGSFKLLDGYDLGSDVGDWLEENIMGDWHYEWETFDEPKICFTHEEDLLAFKLRWI